MIASPASHPAVLGDTLRLAPRGGDELVAFFGGASNFKGVEEEPGSFGGPATVAFPAGLTLYVDGELLTKWADPYGPEVGFVDAAVREGRDVSRWTILKRSVPGSAMTSWYQGGTPLADDAIAYAAELEVVPHVVAFMIPGADTATAGLGNLVWSKLPQVLDPLLTAWRRPGGLPGVILCGPVAYDDGTDPGHATARASARRYTAGGAGRRVWVSTDGCSQQDGSTHLDAAGQLELGRRCWLPVRRGGVA